MYLTFYKQEDVERYLQSIKDGKVDIKDVLQAFTCFCNYIPGIDEHHWSTKWNTNYFPPYLAIDCKTDVGTGINVILPINEGYIRTV
jgi:hypothetical protein